MKNKILFYSSVKSLELFETQKFYKIDIDILKSLNFEVIVTNKLIDFLFFWNYNLAFIYFYRYGLFASIIAKLFGRKVYFTGGIDDLDKFYATDKNYLIQKWLFKLCYIFADKCILVSSTDMENVCRIYKNNVPSKVSLSFHSIDVDRFINKELITKQNLFTTIVWMETKPNVVRKGVDLSLFLFNYMVKNFSEFNNSKFIIMGRKGKGTDYLMEICSKLHILDKVEFTDEVSEDFKVEILKKSRYYFQLSKYEGFGVAAMEALAAGNIVFHSGKGGLKDSIGQYGVLVDIEKDIQSQLPNIIKKTNEVNDEFLSSAVKYVVDNFSNSTRKDSFKKILINYYVQK